MRLAALLLLALVAAGCTAKEPAPVKPAPLQPAATEAPVLLAPTPHGTLRVALDVQDRWVRPGEDVVATAHVSPSARVLWLLAARNPIPSPAWPHQPVDAAPVPPAEERAVARLADPGRYVFGLAGEDGPRLNVTVDPRLPMEAGATVEARDGRVIPDEATVGRGGLLVVRNGGEAEAILLERDWMGLLPVEGPAVRFAMPRGIDMGDYDLTALAADPSGAVGEATARIVFDLRKPDANQTLGPFNGTLRLGAAPPAGDEPVDHAFTARFAMRGLDVWFNATSDLPAPASIVVQVVDAAGRPLDTSEAGASGHLALRDLPAGAYALRVRPAQGAMLRYSVEAHAQLVLVTPDSFFGA